MDKALREMAIERGRARRDWRKRMSDHVAYALLVYTALQIFVTMSAIKTGIGSAMPYFALIVLVAAIIPACRFMERKWEGLGDGQATDPELAGVFRRDIMLLWACAIGLPFLPTITTIVLPQAFRGAIAPLGNTLIALTKNTTVLATIGVAEPALMMRNMFEFNISLLYPIFIIVAAGFVILTLPMGLFFTWWSRKLAVQR